MTYCCGILVRDGIVMFADTRTNAGVDNISTFRKLHVVIQPGQRIMAVASAGNLSISQSVISMLREGWENPNTGETETLMNAPTLFQAAQRVGRTIRQILRWKFGVSRIVEVDPRRRMALERNELRRGENFHGRPIRGRIVRADLKTKGSLCTPRFKSGREVDWVGIFVGRQLVLLL